MTTVASNCNFPQSQVAQQVMGLFQGALDFEKELAIFEEESAKAYAAFTQPKETNSRSKDEPAAVKSSPTREQVSRTRFYSI